MNKPFPALCRDCKHSKSESGSEWSNRCLHPLVSSTDAWSLANNNPKGKSCYDERKSKSWFAPCGEKGKLWEAKNG